jgi:hypothetical protein
MPGNRHSSRVFVPLTPREGSVSKAVHSKVSSFTHFSNTVSKYSAVSIFIKPCAACLPCKRRKNKITASSQISESVPMEVGLSPKCVLECLKLSLRRIERRRASSVAQSYPLKKMSSVIDCSSDLFQKEVNSVEVPYRWGNRPDKVGVQPSEPHSGECGIYLRRSRSFFVPLIIESCREGSFWRS